MSRAPSPEEVALLPTDRLAVLVRLDGAPAVVGASGELLGGEDPLDPSRPPLAWGGGDAVAELLDRGDGLVYRPRVWGARGLLHVEGPEAAGAVVDALTDESWRVCEMAAKVTRAHQVGAAADTLTRL